MYCVGSDLGLCSRRCHQGKSTLFIKQNNALIIFFNITSLMHISYLTNLMFFFIPKLKLLFKAEVFKLCIIALCVGQTCYNIKKKNLYIYYNNENNNYFNVIILYSSFLCIITLLSIICIIDK